MTPDFNKSMLSPPGFKLQINAAEFPAFEYFCTSVTFPTVSLPIIESKYRNHQIEVSGDTVRYEPLSVTFIIDEDMKNYLELYNWMYKNARESITYRDITLNILTTQNTPNISVQFMNATITDLASFEFNTQNTDVTYTTCTATFYYDAFKINVQ